MPLSVFAYKYHIYTCVDAVPYAVSGELYPAFLTVGNDKPARPVISYDRLEPHPFPEL